MEHHYFGDFSAVFTRLLWLVSLGVSRDNENRSDVQFLEALCLEIIIWDSVTYNNLAV